MYQLTENKYCQHINVALAILFLILISSLFTGCQPLSGVIGVEPTPTLAPVVVHNSIPYMDQGMAYQKLDIYVPEGIDDVIPTIFVITNWGEPRSSYEKLAFQLAERGFAVVVASRVSGTWTAYRFPQAEDTFCALAWVHANALKYGFHPHQIVVFGHGMGGGIASLIGTIDSDEKIFMQDCTNNMPRNPWAQGVISYGGWFFLVDQCIEGDEETDCIGRNARYFMIPKQEYTQILENLSAVPIGEWRSQVESNNGTFDKNTSTYASFLPLFWLDNNDPPFLLIHDPEDSSMPATSSEVMAEMLTDAGIAVDLNLIPHIGHNGQNKTEVVDVVVAYLDALFDEAD